MTMSNCRIDPASIGVLQTVLSNLNNFTMAGGNTLPDEVWGCPAYDSGRYLRNEVECNAEFNEAMGAMYKLRESRAALSLLLSSVDRTLASLRRATYPAVLARGILALPVEVLGHIFMFASASRWDVPLRLSWVCRRFRSVVLAMPRAWSVLPPPHMDESRLEAFTARLKRSKNVGIQVQLPLMVTEDCEQNPDWDDAIRMLMVHKHRWTSLCVDLATVNYVPLDDEATGTGEQAMMKLQFPDATLNTVEFLSVGDSPERFSWMSYGSDSYDDASPEFYSSWRFPNLKTLVSEMHIPPPGVFPSLVVLSLDLSLHDLPMLSFNNPNARQSTLNALVAFLNSIPTLQSFKLVAGEYSYGEILDTIAMPSLTSLCLTNQYAHPESLRFLRCVSSSLVIPAVENISIRVSVSDKKELVGDDRNGCLSSFFPSAQAYKNLKKFRLEYIVENDIPMRALRDAENFPALEEIEISSSSAPCLVGWVEAEAREKTRLRRVRFRDVHGEHGSAIRDYTIKGDELEFDSYFAVCDFD